jgi:threonine dehydrogenase-like Zn-dependent dehydrogenase
MTKPEFNTIVTVPKPYTVEFVKRPYPLVKPGSVLVKTEIAAVCVDDRMYTDHEFPMTEGEEAFKISASQRCGKILLYPHGLPNAQGGG